MDLVFFLAVCTLAVVFTVSAIGKFLDFPGTRDALRGFRVPDALLPIGAVFLPTVELLCAVLLIPGRTSRAGAVISAILLVGFIVGISASLIRGDAPDCHCFGQIHSAPVSWRTLVRNLVLLALAAVLLVGRSATVEPLHSIVVGLVAAAAGTIAFVWTRTRSNRDTTEREVLALGATAPDFALPELGGRTVALHELIARGLPTVLMFTSPNCGPCIEVMPDIGRWQQTLTSAASVVVVARGDLADNRAKKEEYGLSTVLMQKEAEVGEAYRIEGTPSAVAIGPDGTLATYVMGGAAGVKSVLDVVMHERVRSMWRKATGTELPEPTGEPSNTD